MQQPFMEVIFCLGALIYLLERLFKWERKLSEDGCLSFDGKSALGLNMSCPHIQSKYVLYSVGMRQLSLD